MNSANELLEQAVGESIHDNVPYRVRQIVERHHQTLLDLAAALLKAGHEENDVVHIIKKASESFRNKIKSEIERQQQ